MDIIKLDLDFKWKIKDLFKNKLINIQVVLQLIQIQIQIEIIIIDIKENLLI